MAITSSASPSVLNQSVRFTVTVSAAAPGSGTPTGTVQFSIDGSKFGSAVALAGSSATSTSISTLKLGNHTVTASYSGDKNFTASTASSFTQVVSKDNNTTTSLVVTVNPSVYGQSISFTASVAAVAPGTGTPTGSVTFFDGSTTLKTVTLTAGAATYTTTKLVTGQHTITAAYNGNSTFAISTSAALTQTVNQDHTSTVVTASADPSVYGHSVTFTATVSAASPGSGTPTGSVTFMDGLTALGSATLSGGKASFKTSSLAAGSQAITAVYGGDGNFITSKSAALTQKVQRDATTRNLKSSANPSVFGHSVTFTATVKAASPGSGTPTGSVTFMDGLTALGSATLSGGKASFKTKLAGCRLAGDHRGLWRRWQLHHQQVSRPDPEGPAGRDDNKPEVVRPSVRLRPVGDLHGHSQGCVTRQRHALRHRDVLRRLDHAGLGDARWDRHGELHNLVPLGRLTFDQGVLWRRRRFQGEHLGGSQAVRPSIEQ